MKRFLKFMMVATLVAVAMTVVAFATVDEDHAEMEINLTPVAGQTDIYELTVTCSAKSTMQVVELMFTVDKTIFTPVNASTYKNIAVAALRKQSIAMLPDPVLDYPFTLQISEFKEDGNYMSIQVVTSADLDVRDYHTYTDFTIFKVVFKASAANIAALTPEQFFVNQALITVQNDTEGVANKTYGYKYEAATDGEVDFINNVVDEPEVVVITIPVAAGDKVYLQDGTVATMAEANDAYEVPATVGYVAVNTGKTAQKTYYVDGTAATLVHTNGIVSTEENDLRGPDETSSVAEDTSGLRFLMNHNPANRTVTGHEITEVGVLMTVESNKVLAAIGSADNITFDMVDGGFVKSGYALGNGYDRAFNTENDTNWVISAVMYNIKLNAANVQVNIVCRPFYKVGDTYIYGETMKATLYDVAKSIKEGGYVGCTDELKAYVDEIVTLVDGVDTPVVDEEIIIDISSLYTIVG